MNRTIALAALALLGPGAVALARADCATWTGKMVDKWPGASDVTLEACDEAEGRVTGIFTFVSQESGWDRRRLAGSWSADRTHLSLHDDLMIESHPRKGWRLCAADWYELDVQDDGTLRGAFLSTDCDDEGEITLAREQPEPPAVAEAPAPRHGLPPFALPVAVLLAAVALLLVRRALGAVVPARG